MLRGLPILKVRHGAHAEHGQKSLSAREEETFVEVRRVVCWRAATRALGRGYARYDKVTFVWAELTIA